MPDTVGSQTCSSLNLPRPVRAWDDDQIFGLKDLSKFEHEQVQTDDILMWRFLMLYAVSQLVRGAQDINADPVELLVEQPAEPADKPEVVSFWRTQEWKTFEQVYKLGRQSLTNPNLDAPLPNRLP